MTTPRHTAAALRASALALAAALLGACVTFPAPGEGDWSSVRPEKAPVAQAVTFAHPVRFAASDGVLLDDQRETLDQFIVRAQPRRADLVLLRVHPGMVNAARAAAVAERLRMQGLMVSFEGAADNQPADVVRVSVQTYVVTLAGCPDWTHHPSISYDNEPTSNFGCASARNLGLMIADPADLIEGHAIGPADGSVQAAAVKRYRAGETKALLGAGSTADPQAKNAAPAQTGGN